MSSDGKVTSTVYDEDNPLTVEIAKEILGWEEEGSLNNWGPRYLVRDAYGMKIRCTNNNNNRPLYQATINILSQEILRGNWKLNGEPIIVCRNGSLANGQHTLIALITSAQLWLKYPASYPFWKREPYIEKVLVEGIDPSDDVINTLDTARPRRLYDVIYRSALFQDLNERDRRDTAKLAEGACKLFWVRTGAGYSGLKPTLAEQMQILQRHPRLLECSVYINKTMGSKPHLKYFMPTGWAPALLYLMSCSTTDPFTYYPHREEVKGMDWTHGEKAKTFFRHLCQGSETVEALKSSLHFAGEAVDAEGLSTRRRLALIVKAWNAFLKNSVIKKADLKLKQRSVDGWKYVAECPTVGGIDLGDPKEQDEVDLLEAGTKEEDVKKSTKQIRQSKIPGEDGESEKPKKKRRKTKAELDLVGRQRWVDGDGEPWRGKVIKVEGKNATLRIGQGFQGAGNEVSVPVSSLLAKQPIG